MMLGLQNAPEGQRLLEAAADRYRLAKNAYRWQIVLSVVVPVVFTFGSALSGDITPWVALYGLAIALLDPLLVDSAYRRWKRDGALMQEAFDCTVLGIPWDTIHCGDRPPMERVTEWANRFRRKPTPQQMSDWYPPGLSVLPLSLLQLACQRISSFWDLRLRRRYVHFLVGGVTLVTLLSLVAASLVDQSVRGLVLSLAALSPALHWVIREVRRHQAAWYARERVASLVVARWRDTLSHPMESAAAEVRGFQNLLFDRRSADPEVFDWIYSRFRPADEKDMRESAEQMVREWTSAV